ncbi:hypothetical protein HYU14_00810 [Candidatus Woesearchaeota archaeon]|nr:hypothetical protein [Candidatus Woesearchaeota archaeon]
MRQTGKKGQVSLFIIVGLVLLIGVSMIILYQNINEKKITPEVGKASSSEVPQWAVPVKDLMESCIASIAIDGLRKIGQHGGYINPRDSFLSGRAFTFDDNPTESDFFQPSALSSSQIAYWWYLKSPNACIDCDLSTNKPTLDEIAVQISKYVNQRLHNCTKYMEDFEKQGFEVDIGALTTATSIPEKGVDIKVENPITLKKEGTTATIPEFSVHLDLNLKDIFELALKIILFQADEMALEQVVTTLISLKAGTPDSSRIPPMFASDSKSTQVTWIPSKVEKNLKEDMLASYIPLIQVDKTRGAKKIAVANTLEQGLYDLIFWDVPILGNDDIKINMEYNPKQEIYFDITPQRAGILKPESATRDSPLGITPSRTLNIYNFYYDLSFPVVLTLWDNNSLKQSGIPGYIFQVAMEGNIRDNKDLLQWHEGSGSVQIDSSNLQFTGNIGSATAGTCVPAGSKFQCTLDGREYPREDLCTIGCKIDSSVQGDFPSLPSLECDPGQKISGEHTINLKDKKTKEPIEGASISYTCGNSRICRLGTTDAAGTFKGKSQICIGDGIITAEKPDYMAATMAGMTVMPGQSVSINLQSRTFAEKEVEVVFINISNMFRVKRLLSSLLTTAAFSIYDEAALRENNANKFNNDILPYIMRSQGILPALFFEANGQIANKVCYCQDIAGKKDYNCFQCLPDNINPALLSQKDIQNIRDYFKLPNSAVYIKPRRFPTEPIVEYSYFPVLYGAHLKILRFFHYSDMDPRKVAESLGEVYSALHEVNSYIKQVMADPNLIGEIIEKKSNGQKRGFTGDILPSQEIIGQISALDRKIQHEFSNLQARSNTEKNQASNIQDYRAAAKPFSGPFEGVIQLNRIKESPSEGNLPLPSAIVGDSENTRLSLMPGKYEATINVQRKNPAVISRNNLLDTIRLPSGSNFIAGQDVEYNLLGGAQISQSNGYWNIGEDELDGSSKIRFYAFITDIPENAEDFSEMGNIGDYSKRYRLYIEPEFLP